MNKTTLVSAALLIGFLYTIVRFYTKDHQIDTAEILSAAIMLLIGGIIIFIVKRKEKRAD